MRLTFLDFETTGLIKKDQENPDVIQAALKIIIDDNKPIFINKFFSTKKWLSPIVKAETWIFEKDLEGKEEFKDSKMLKEIIEKQNSTIQIAHNWIWFDFKLIENFWYKPKYIIDTLKLAKYFLTDEDKEKVDWKLKLGYLRFLFQDLWYLDKEYIEKPLAFHTADYDVETLEQVFYAFIKYYKDKIDNTKEEKEILTIFINVTKNPILLDSINFWKHSWTKFNELPLDYLTWLFKNALEDKDEDFCYTVKYYISQLNPSFFWETLHVDIETNKVVNSSPAVPPKIEIEDMPKPILITSKKLDDDEINENLFQM